MYMRGPNPTELRTQLLTLLQDQKVHALSDVKESIAKRFDVS
jgi:hypothetical protein